LAGVGTRSKKWGNRGLEVKKKEFMRWWEVGEWKTEKNILHSNLQDQKREPTAAIHVIKEKSWSWSKAATYVTGSRP